MSNLNELFTRTHCSCAQCKAACRTMPGTLAPGDVERIADYFGVEITPDFISKNFRASDGFRIHKSGEHMTVPTIVPAQKSNGECIFYANGSCTVHEVSPFGCSQFMVCDDTVEGSFATDEKLHALVDACQESPAYVTVWGHLFQRGLTAPPLKERKLAFTEELKILYDTGGCCGDDARTT